MSLERRMQPRLGGRKLPHLLRADFIEAGVSVGRDRFFELLAESDLLVVPKPGAPRTTNSGHSLPVFGNLLADTLLCAPNEGWVSDLTYIRTDERFLYAALITDACSRKIVGAHIGDSLDVDRASFSVSVSALRLSTNGDSRSLSEVSSGLPLSAKKRAILTSITHFKGFPNQGSHFCLESGYAKNWPFSE